MQVKTLMLHASPSSSPTIQNFKFQTYSSLEVDYSLSNRKCDAFLCLLFFLLLFDTGLDTLQKIFVPQLGVPGMEPASEWRWLRPLLNGGDGNTAAARRVAIHIVLGWKENKTQGYVCE